MLRLIQLKFDLILLFLLFGISVHCYSYNILSTLTSEDYIDVKTFGATGIGIENDDIFIQDAINEASNSQIKTVFFPKGLYKLNNSLLISSDGITFLFEEGAELFVSDFMDKPAIIIRGSIDGATKVKNISILGPGIINGNSSNQSNYKRGKNMPFGIIATNVSNLLVSGIELMI